MQYYINATIINETHGKPFVSQAILTDSSGHHNFYPRHKIQDNQRIFFIFDEYDKINAIFNDYEDAVKFKWHSNAVRNIHYLHKYSGKIDLKTMIKNYKQICEKYNIKPVENWETPQSPIIEFNINEEVFYFDTSKIPTQQSENSKNYIFISNLILLSKNNAIHPFVSANHQLT